MENVEVIKIEERRDAWLVYSVRLHALAGEAEFSIAVRDHGTTVLNEAAALRATLGFVEELEVSTRLRLGAI